MAMSSEQSQQKEFTADKMMDGDYYMLTLAAIAPRYLNAIRQTASEYVDSIFRRIQRESGGHSAPITRFMNRYG